MLASRCTVVRRWSSQSHRDRLHLSMAAIILLLLYIIGVVHASIRVLATNKTYPLYDIYGETDPRPYNFSGPLVATSFVPDKFCSLQLPSTSPSLAHGDRGVAFLINAADVTAAKCSTFSWVLRSLPADFPGAVVPRNITALMIFVAEDDSSVDFGNKETEQTDNYWLHTPSRLQLALVGADTGRTLASALDHSPANSTRIHIERDPGPWNRYMDSSAFYAATYIIRASNVAVIAAALILLFVEFRSHLRIGWFRLAIYLNTIIYAFGNIFTMMRYAVAKYRTTIMFVIWMIGNTVFTAVIVRWSRFLLRLPGHHIAYYSLFALCTANIVLYCIALSLSIYAGYCTNPFTIHVATILYSTVSTTFFAFGAVAAFYCNQRFVDFVKLLENAQTPAPRALTKLLWREYSAIIIICSGRVIAAVGSVMMAFNAIYTTILFYTMETVYIIGMTVVLYGMLYMLTCQRWFAEQLANEPVDICLSSPSTLPQRLQNMHPQRKRSNSTWYSRTPIAVVADFHATEEDAFASAESPNNSWYSKFKDAAIRCWPFSRSNPSQMPKYCPSSSPSHAFNLDNWRTEAQFRVDQEFGHSHSDHHNAIFHSNKNTRYIL